MDWQRANPQQICFGQLGYFFARTSIACGWARAWQSSLKCRVAPGNQGPHYRNPAYVKAQPALPRRSPKRRIEFKLGRGYRRPASFLNTLIPEPPILPPDRPSGFQLAWILSLEATGTSLLVERSRQPVLTVRFDLPAPHPRTVPFSPNLGQQERHQWLIGRTPSLPRRE